jgi:glutaredoxin-like protein
MQFFSDEAKKEISKKISKMDSVVKFRLFVTKKDPDSANVMENFLNEVASASDKLSFEKLVIEQDKEEAAKYGIMAVPAFAIEGSEHRKVLFYGIPLGQEFSTFLLDIVDVSNLNPNIPDEFKKKAKELEKLHIIVFVNENCPYCPQAAKLAHDLAIINPNIQADVIDTAQFKPIAGAFNVTSVPTTVLDKKLAIRGLKPLDVIFHNIDKLREK